MMSAFGNRGGLTGQSRPVNIPARTSPKALFLDRNAQDLQDQDGVVQSLDSFNPVHLVKPVELDFR
jgi:hypothetical protein